MAKTLFTQVYLVRRTVVVRIHHPPEIHALKTVHLRSIAVYLIRIIFYTSNNSNNVTKNFKQEHQFCHHINTNIRLHKNTRLVTVAVVAIVITPLHPHALTIIRGRTRALDLAVVQAKVQLHARCVTNVEKTAMAALVIAS